ncbi:MAG: hypothetical protein ABIA04_11185 [Pseudomonadota bacterium]
MKIKKSNIFICFSMLFILVVFLSCTSSSSSNEIHLDHPSSWALTAEFNETKFAYISNESSGFVAVLDVQDGSFEDFDDRLDNDQSFFVGGQPTSINIAQDSSGTYDFLLIVTTYFEAESGVVFIGANYSSGTGFSHEFLKASDDLRGGISTPVFIDEGQGSDPSIESYSIDYTTVENNLWMLKYNEDISGYFVYQYEIDSSSALLQTNTIKEDVEYSSNNSEISIKINSGLNETSDDDTFYFYTSAYYPIVSDGKIINSILSGDYLYLIEQDSPASYIKQISIANKTLTETLNLSSTPSKIKIYEKDNETFLFISHFNDTDADGDGIIDSHTLSLYNITNDTLDVTSLETLDLSSKVSNFSFNDDDNIVYFYSAQTVNSFNYNSGLLERSNNFSENLSFMFLTSEKTTSAVERLADYGSSVRRMLLSSDILGNFYFIDTLNFSDSTVDPVIDPYINSGGKESESSAVVFHDTGDTSEPVLRSVITEDGVTLDEEWLVIFEATLPSSESTTGFISTVKDDAGNVEYYILTDASASFTSLALSPKYYVSDDTEETLENDAIDLIIIKQTLYEDYHIELTSILSDTQLKLSSEQSLEDLEAAAIEYEIKANESFLVYGSVSGVQASRASSNSSYLSDNEEVIFTIQNSVLSPATEGDYFSFDTYKGVDFVSVGNLPADAFEYSYDDNDYFYILSKGSSTITIFDYSTLQDVKTIY